MKNRLFLFSLLLFSSNSYLIADQKITVPVNEHGERHIVIVVASYNNKPFYKQNLESIFRQVYSNYHVIYIDDCSSDDTHALVKDYIRLRRMENKVLLIHNENRVGALCNQYNAIHRCKDTDLIIILDGDDFFHDRHVLSYINGVYLDDDLWLTYGQFMVLPTNTKGWCIAMPPDIVNNNAFREFGHIPGHLRTFYAGLFKQIKKEDLMYEGDFFRMTGDIAAMFPMIEMAREGHFRFVNKILMDYNDCNPLNNYKVGKGLERKLDLEIRSRPRYDVIAKPFLSCEGGIEKELNGGQPNIAQG